MEEYPTYNFDNLKHQFEASLDASRQIFDQLVNSNENELVDLRAELSRKDARMKEMEIEINRSRVRINELTSTIQKLFSVRVQLDSFIENDPLINEIVKSSSSALPSSTSSLFENQSYASLQDANQPHHDLLQPYPIKRPLGDPTFSKSPTTSLERPSRHTSRPTSNTIDGRDFFKSARRTLVYDEFSTLLQNVKAFNARHQSRLDTLNAIKPVLAHRHPDLFHQFLQLIQGTSRENLSTNSENGYSFDPVPYMSSDRTGQ